MFFSIYSVIGVLVFFKWDKHAGVVLCLAGMVYIPHMAGFIMQFPKIVLIEVLLFLGMAVCAYNGPSGGILARLAHSDSTGSGRLARGGQVSHPQGHGRTQARD